MKKRIIEVTLAVCLMFTMVFGMANLSFADSKLDTLLAETEGLEEYLRNLTFSMTTLSVKQENLQTTIDEVQVKIDENEVILAETETARAEQYDAMKLRIKFLYETNEVDYLAALMSAQSIADIVNKFQYISSVVEYDRNMLEKYSELTTAVETLQTGLVEKKTELETMQADILKNLAEAEALMNQAEIDMDDMGLDKTDFSEIISDYEEEYGEEIREEVIEQIEKETEEETEAVTEDYGQDSTEPSSEEVTTPTEEPSSEEITTEEQTEPTTEEVTLQPTTEETTTEETTAEPVTIPTTTEYVEITTTPPETTTEYVEPTTEEPTTQYEEPDNSGNDPLWDVARVVYLENGCMYPTSSYRSIYLTACVIFNRAYNWYGGSISAAIFDSGQYATAYKYDNWGGGPLTINDITWTAVYDAYYNLDPNPYYQANGDWLDGMGLELYYRDPVTDEVFYYGY